MKTKLFFLAMTLLIANFLHAQWEDQGFRLISYPTNYNWTSNLKVVDAQTIWVNIANYGSNEAPRVARSLNGGATWQTIQIPNTNGYSPLGLSASSANTAWVSISNEDPNLNKILKTSNGGTSWQTLLQGPAAGYIVHFFDNNNGLAFRDPQNIKITSNGGQTWQTPASVPAVNGSPQFYIPGEQYDVVGNTIWVPLDNGKILRSTDKGLNWTVQNTPLSDPINLIAFNNANNGWAASLFDTNGFIKDNTSVIRTTDGGQTWTVVSNANLPNIGGNGLFVKAIEAVPGTNGTLLMSVSKQYFPTDYTVYKTTDNGNSWTLYSDCPKSGFGIESFDFLSPTVGWGATGGAFSISDPFLYKYTEQTHQSKVVYRVDLGNRTPSGAGVHVATDYDGWNPSAHPMTHIGNNVYETTISYPPGTTVHYKFLNGNAWGQNESVLSGCGVPNGQGSYDREVTTTACQSVALHNVEFGGCIPSGQRQPQGNTACNPNIHLVCEVFEAYNVGKLGIQSDEWQATGCNYDDVEGDPCDYDVASYYNGFTNYTGGRGMHVAGNAGGDASFDFGNQTGGRLEFSMQIYATEGGATGMSLVVDPGNPDFLEGVYFYTADGFLYMYSRDFSDFDVSEPFAYNVWHKMTFIIDFDNQTREFWLDGQQLLSIQDPYPLTSLSRLYFYRPSSFFNTNYLGYFVDDMLVKQLPPAAGGGGQNRSSRAVSAVPLHRPNASLEDQMAAWKTIKMNGVKACPECPESATSAQPVSAGSNLQWTLFPNPTTQAITVHYAAATPGEGNLELVNALGQRIETRKLGDNKVGVQRFNVSALPSGVYTVKLNIGDQVESKQFVKQ